MRVRVLGCSGGIGAGARTSALLLDDDILIDAGTGLGDLPLKDIDAIRHVFLTHAHLDHIAGLPMLVDTLFEEDFETPLTVYARGETLDAVHAHIFNDVIWPDFRKLPSTDRSILRFEECKPGDVIEVGEREFHAVDVQHTVPALGYTVRSPHGSFAVSGDTRANETLWPALNAMDELQVLVIEVSFPDEMEALAVEAGHYSPKTLARDLERLRHTPDIWLTGMKPGAEQAIFEQMLEAAPNRRVQMLSRGTVLTV